MEMINWLPAPGYINKLGTIISVNIDYARYFRHYLIQNGDRKYTIISRRSIIDMANWEIHLPDVIWYDTKEAALLAHSIVNV